ncbi:Cell division cycle protein 23 [Folsomia candida]|uniref:Cell division cycle protein 23 n=1 Tax=Folsomia candida TaxID=158441 RepID=A0A226F3F8_FOLCA|nr:Cell division cycle protein 23 [Folsomia candida]
MPPHSLNLDMKTVKKQVVRKYTIADCNLQSTRFSKNCEMTYFDNGEYLRCAFVAEPFSKLCPILRFLRFYSLFLDCEKKRLESMSELTGNLHSLKREHPKAIEYFERALIHPYYLSAWTLMCREFMELKNSNAAIQCYREAGEVNKHDYRPWNGLGQTYDILNMSGYISKRIVKDEAVVLLVQLALKLPGHETREIIGFGWGWNYKCRMSM